MSCLGSLWQFVVREITVIFHGWPYQFTLQFNEIFCHIRVHHITAAHFNREQWTQIKDNCSRAGPNRPITPSQETGIKYCNKGIIPTSNSIVGRWVREFAVDFNFTDLLTILILNMQIIILLLVFLRKTRQLGSNCKCYFYNPYILRNSFIFW